MKNKVNDYINISKGNLEGLKKNSKIIRNIAGILSECKKNGNTLFLCGNGGSSSTASHLAQDFQKMCGIRTYCLSDNIPLVTAWSNDNCYSCIFEKQLEGLSKSKDVLMVFSGSGDSKNIIHAVFHALQNDMKVIALIGETGGEVKKIYDKLKGESPFDITLLYIDSDMQHAEDWHLVAGHLILKLVGMKP